MSSINWQELGRQAYTSRDLWSRRSDLFKIPGKDVYVYGVEEQDMARELEETLSKLIDKTDKKKESMTVSDAAALRSEAVKLLAMANRIEKFTLVDDFEQGTLLRWSRVYGNAWYAYAAIKVITPEGYHCWYITGEKAPRSPHKIDALRDLWISWDVQEVEVFTGGPSWVIGRDEKPPRSEPAVETEVTVNPTVSSSVTSSSGTIIPHDPENK